MDVLSTASAMFGLILIALAVYHWHLGSQRPGLASTPRRSRADRAPATPSVGCDAREAGSRNGAAESAPRPHAMQPGAMQPRPTQRSGIFPRAVLHAPADARHEEREPRPAREVAEPSAPHGAPFELAQDGVYTTSESMAARPEQRGQCIAERVLSDALGARTRRGRKAALDVIVVGASREGIAAALRLLGAGLRVLLVDAGSGDGLRAARLVRDPGLTSALRALRRERLPIVWGHRVLAVATRPDGMLELSAERAAWYTANVIVAVPGGSRREREHAA